MLWSRTSSWTAPLPRTRRHGLASTKIVADIFAFADVMFVRAVLQARAAGDHGANGFLGRETNNARSERAAADVMFARAGTVGRPVVKKIVFQKRVQVAPSLARETSFVSVFRRAFIASEPKGNSSFCRSVYTNDCGSRGVALRHQHRYEERVPCLQARSRRARHAARSQGGVKAQGREECSSTVASHGSVVQDASYR